MVKEKKDYNSIKEITRREILRISADEKEKANKLKRDSNKQKRVISNYKENEKKLQRQIVILRQKLDFLKENTIGSLFALSENIGEIKDSFIDYCDKFSDRVQAENLKSFVKEFDYISDFILNVCNSIELNSGSANDKKLIDNSKDIDIDFESEESEFDSKNDYQWDFNSTNKKNIEENQFAAEKIKKLFYEKPNNTSENANVNRNNISVGLSKNYNGLFDFNEALNPTMSLSDIMSDIMSDDKKNSNVVSTSEMGNVDEDDNKNDYDAWFMSLQNIISKETNKK